jgi:KUP system potassium uptake protein
LGAIGIVFGDIGTSPLYAVKEVFHAGLTTDANHVLGALSLIFWSLTLVVTTKYAIFIMRADNKGEGGIMALMVLALHGSRDKPGKMRFIITIGLIGAVLFYGDSMITPAISVLSAVEGLSVVALPLAQYVVPITVAVLGGLFILQAKGTGEVGKLFAPVMCIWFAVLGIMGIINIFQQPEVLMAVNPYYAINLLGELGWKGFLVMGSVVLVVTGVEALYADMGHFGLKPIRYAWFSNEVQIIFQSVLVGRGTSGSLT